MDLLVQHPQLMLTSNIGLIAIIIGGICHLIRLLAFFGIRFGIPFGLLAFLGIGSGIDMGVFAFLLISWYSYLSLCNSYWPHGIFIGLFAFLLISWHFEKLLNTVTPS